MRYGAHAITAPTASTAATSPVLHRAHCKPLMCRCVEKRSLYPAGGRAEMKVLRNVHNWLHERLEWEDLIAPLQKKTGPRHRLSFWYFLRGIKLFLFLLQV